MRTPKFEINVFNLDRADDAARQAHADGRLSLTGWRAAAARIKQLKGLESFRTAHAAALADAKHPEHAARTAELGNLFAKAYPDESEGGSFEAATRPY
jgi:hypothetical protein